MKSNRSYYIDAALLCGAIVLIRLLTLNFPDLVDTTEGRYAGIAQLMLRRDDWVTPWIHLRGVEKPYLGKPPLHFWMVQLSFLLFGQNNFAARLPGVVSALGIAAALWVACTTLIGARAAVISLAVFSSSCMVFFLGGSVILDVTLTFGITAALVGFLLADRGKWFGYLFFAGMGFGVLVKGPLACVLVGGIIFPWAVLHRFATKTWPKQIALLPWKSGALLFLLIVLPWYIWAEIRNPGFLRYFLVNENFGRYLKTEYGDEYGTGHRQPFGAAWGMFFLALVPWSVVITAAIALRYREFFSRKAVTTVISDPLLLFSLCWTLSCPVLLLGARQYTATYLVPSLPGFALLAGVCWERYSNGTWLSDLVARRTILFPCMIICGLGVVGSLISLPYGGSATYAVITLVASVGGLGWLFSRQAQLNQYQLVLSLSIFTAVVYGAATMCFDNHLSNNRSSRRALQAANALVTKDAPLRLGFPYYYPFSAAFYAGELGRSELSLTCFEESVSGASNIDLFLVRKQGNMRRLMEECPQCKEVARVGHWYIVKPHDSALPQ